MVECYMLLDRYKYMFTRKQYSTIKGQIKSGDYVGAKKGIMKIIRRID